ncbi:lysophospholipid acyltransferase family protein [Wenxinia saemankumensis]|uniref:DUF374 domain-containing protein n=1 Tax=Wenxinia saemankumensis TaxID=1447782 RepID=A0A1M6C581_9RHOB|nr:hypothetical protein [Wenxinia saemankumensis]SHI56180.1 hypothetical protein SAMN05444417_1015 [Wenxinia saemankumensis]
MTEPRPSLRARLARHPALLRPLAWPLSLWIGTATDPRRWRIDGREELAAALAQGPVILVLWHEHIALVARHWPHRAGPITNVHGEAPIARLAGQVQARFGPRPVALGGTGLAATRLVMGRLKAGTSIGLAADGPRGPRRVVRDPPLDWARASGVPVFLYAAAPERGRRLASWDRLVWPAPFTGGAALFRRWEARIPRRPDEAARAALKADMGRALTAMSDIVEARAVERGGRAG